MDSDKNGKDSGKPSNLHFWGGALSGGSTVPLSWATSGAKAAEKGIEGALLGGILGLNALFGDDDEES